MNSAHRSCYIAGDLLIGSRRARGGLGFVLAWERLHRGFSLLPWLSYKALEPSPFFFSLALFSRRPCSSPASSHRSCSVSIIAAKPSIGSPTPCAPSHPTVVDWFHRESAVRTLLPRDRPQHRRAPSLRGQRSPVSCCLCFVYLQLCLDAVVPSCDAGWCGECFGTLAVALGLAVGEFSSISAVVTVVKRGR